VKTVTLTEWLTTIAVTASIGTVIGWVGTKFVNESDFRVDGLSGQRASLVPVVLQSLVRFLNNPSPAAGRDLVRVLFEYGKTHAEERATTGMEQQDKSSLRCSCAGCSSPALSEECPYCFDHLP
jgi:hypothetical protein